MSSKFFSNAIAWVLLVVPTTALSQYATYVRAENLPEISPHYGESAYGLQLGLSVRTEVPGNPASIETYVTLRNTGTGPVFIDPQSVGFLDFAANSLTGKKAVLMDHPESTIFIMKGFAEHQPYTLEAGASATVLANLSRVLLVPEAGRYFFLMSTKMTISTQVPPTKASLQPVELIAGSVEFDVPASMVYTNTGKHPSSRVAKPLSAYYVDPSTGRTPEERAMLQRANETRSNDFRKHWPHLIDGTPVISNGSAAAVSPVAPPPQGTVTVGDREGSRWWLVGVAATCAAVIGFVLLRRR